MIHTSYNQFTAGTITGSGAVSIEFDYYLINNGASNITMVLPNPTTCKGKVFTFSRANGSTGTITINGGGGQIQALAGTLGASTTISAHGARGQGLNIQFWSNGTNWYR